MEEKKKKQRQTSESESKKMAREGHARRKAASGRE